MRILVADDEPLALQRLSRALQEIEGVEVVGTAGDGDDALRLLAPDLAILDIQMPGRSGMAVAAALPVDTRPEVVFLTAFNRYAADAFAVEAVDYLLKPVRLERLRQAVERAKRRRTQWLGAPADPNAVVAPAPPFADRLQIPDRDGGFDLAQSDILWIEAAKDYVLIYTTARSHLLRITMAELEERLHPSILRVHRSAFVALTAIVRRVRCDRGLFSLRLADDSTIQVGPSYAQAVRAVLHRLRPDLS